MKNKYYIAHNFIDVFHFGELKEGQTITTGQSHLEYYDNLDDFEIRLEALSPAAFDAYLNEKNKSDVII